MSDQYEPPTSQPQGTVCPECKSAMGSDSTWRYVDGHYEHRCAGKTPYLGTWTVEVCSVCLGRGSNPPGVGIATGSLVCSGCQGTGLGTLVNKTPTVPVELLQAHRLCPICRGTGKIPMMHSIAVPALTCSTCEGKGTV